MQNLLKIYKKKYGAGNEETTLLNLRTLFVAQILKICTAAGGGGRSGSSCHKNAFDHALFIMNEMLYL